MTVHIKLHGEKADRFEEIKRTVASELGYEPSNPETLGIIMSQVDTDELSVRELLLSGGQR